VKEGVYVLREGGDETTGREKSIKSLKNIYHIIMECAICYEDIKDNKLFKAGCCSINLCVDCVKKNGLDKCPQCKASYLWINETQTTKLLIIENNKLNIKLETADLSAKFAWNECRKMEEKIKGMKNETEIIMRDMVNTILMLMEYKDNKEAEEDEDHEFVNDVQDVVNRLNLIP
jgi:hypothetical protein